MNRDLHARAAELIAQRRVEPLSREDELWLSAHLAECESCSGQDARMADAIASLRSAHIAMPRNLAARTQMRLRMRAEELREHGPANRLIWAVAAMSWVFGLATAPLVWRGFAWLGAEFHLPKLVWMAGLVLWWIVPALVATGVVLLGQKGQASASE